MLNSLLAMILAAAVGAHAQPKPSAVILVDGEPNYAIRMLSFDGSRLTGRNLESVAQIRLKTYSACMNKARTLIAVQSEDYRELHVFSIKKRDAVQKLTASSLGSSNGTRFISAYYWGDKNKLFVYMRTAKEAYESQVVVCEPLSNSAPVQMPIDSELAQRFTRYQSATARAYEALKDRDMVPLGLERADPRFNREEVFGDLFGGAGGSYDEGSGAFMARVGRGGDHSIFKDGQYQQALQQKARSPIVQRRMTAGLILLRTTEGTVEVWNLTTGEYIDSVSCLLIVD